MGADFPGLKSQTRKEKLPGSGWTALQMVAIPCCMFLIATIFVQPICRGKIAIKSITFAHKKVTASHFRVSSGLHMSPNKMYVTDSGFLSGSKSKV